MSITGQSILCAKCKVDCTSHHWMCDRIEGAWCDDCFPETSCGKEMHGEGCPTQVFDDAGEHDSGGERTC